MLAQRGSRKNRRQQFKDENIARLEQKFLQKNEVISDVDGEECPGKEVNGEIFY